jgi:pyrimidine 5'-nucleotidase
MEGVVFFFDCDDCLYQNNWKTANLITAKIDQYCTETLGLETGYAYKLYKKYGTCLRGLTEEKIIEDTPEAIDEFLEYVHNVPLQDINTDEPLRAMIQSMKVKKWVFTASVESHAKRCLEALGVGDLFLGIIDCKAVGLVTKHSPEAFARAMEIAGVTDPEKCIFADDSSSNIGAAKKVGWKTIVVGPLRDGYVEGQKRECAGADLQLDSIHGLKSIMPELFEVSSL